MIGAKVGSYQITDTLGEGGMGVVYIAQHSMLGKKAAVKLLLPELSRNEQIVRRFFNEARAATMVQHKGIIEVFDFGYTDDGQAFIVMELLHGEALTDRIRAQKQVPEDDLIRITRQAASALSAAHQANIVHRDLKPDNIFLCPDPEVIGGERVKVLDFGIAKLTADTMVGAQKTRTGSVMGSPSYMSPEQCQGLTTVDSRSDIYSLGCVMYQMATGQLPFEGEGVGTIIGKHIYEMPPPPQALNPNLSPALDQVLAQCMAKDPNARFQTMDELVAALDRASEGAFTTRSFRRPTTPSPVGYPGEQGAAAASTTLGGAAAQMGTQPPTTQRSKAPIYASVAVVAAAAVIVAVVMLGGGDKEGSSSAAAAAGPAEAAPTPDPPAEALVKAKVDKIAFVINSEPAGAEVYKMPSGSLVGTTPFEKETAPTEGKVVFVVKKPGFEEARVTLDATIGGSETLTLVAVAPKVVSSSKRSRSKRPKAAKPAVAKPAVVKPPVDTPPVKKPPVKKPGLWAD